MRAPQTGAAPHVPSTKRLTTSYASVPRRFTSHRKPNVPMRAQLDPSTPTTWEHPIGTPVTYWPLLKKGRLSGTPRETATRSEPWRLGHGEEVVALDGISGGISVKHLVLRQAEA